MVRKKPPLNVRKSLYLALFKSLMVPLVLLAFFIAAPYWLNNKIHSEIVEAINTDSSLSWPDKQAAQEKFGAVDFEEVCRDNPVGFEKLHDKLVENGVAAQFDWLRCALILSALLVAGLAIAVVVIFVLNERAKKSRDNLIAGYRLGWTIAILAALAKVFLLIPLLAYGSFEFTVLLSNQYFPKLLAVIIISGLIALWKSASVLLKKVPMEFQERLCREVTPADAPELWQAVNDAAKQLHTSPPDRILIGMQLNFYVTELAVRYDSGRTEGKTLFLSYPLLKQLSGDEVLAIIGHELGHFIGEDTRMTREFYPLRFKIHGTRVAMAQSGIAGWPSLQLLNFFHLGFAQAEQKASRDRELLADQKAAALTSPQTAAHALVKFQVAVEAFQRGLADAVKNKAQNLLDIPLQSIVQEKLAADAAFWNQLFEHQLPHPLDSHPSLQTRLDALHQSINGGQAREIALLESESAYAKWFSNRGALFTGLSQQAESAIGKMRDRAQISTADYQTPEGKELLERHFPEKKWRSRHLGLWFLTILFGVIVALCLWGVIGCDAWGLKAFLGAIGIVFGGSIVMYWKRNWKAEFTLNAGGIFYTGWKRPLRFADIEKISGRSNYGNVTLTFRLKQKQPRYWKWSWLPRPARSVGISLGNLNGKSLAIAQTIIRYYARQMEPEPTAAKK